MGYPTCSVQRCYQRKTHPQRTLRVSYLPGMNVDSTIGDSFQIRTKVRDTPGGLIWKSKRTTLENLQMGYLHGFGILAQFSTDLTVRNCDFRPPSDSWRTTAAFADILHVSGARGHIRIYDNNFGFAHDDPINVHGTYVQMVARGQDSHTPTFRYMHSETAGFPQVSVGDQVTLVNRDTLQDLPWRARVTAVSGPSGRDHKNSLTTMSVTFDKPLPGAALPHVVALENLTYSPAVTIRHNHFESIPTRGILVTTRKPVLIKNNVFDQMQMASIYISGDVNGWYESSVVRNVTIRRNVFIRPGLGSDVAQPVIFISPTSGGRDPARAAHSHVKIYDNVFLMEDTGVLDAKNVRDLRFNNNRVTHYLPDSQLKAKASTHSLAVGEMTQLTAESTNSANTPLVTLRGSRDVDLSGNHLDSTFNRSVALKNTSATSVRSDAALPVGKESPAAVHRWIVSDPRLANVSTSGRLTARKTGVVAIFPVYYDGIKEVAGDPVYMQITRQIRGGLLSRNNSGNTVNKAATSWTAAARKEVSPLHRANPALASVRFIGATLPGSSARELASGSGWVTVLSPRVRSLTAHFTPVDKNATVHVRVNSTSRALNNGRITVPITRGITVLEVRVVASDKIHSHIYRWVLLSNSQVRLPAPTTPRTDLQGTLALAPQATRRVIR